MPGLEMDSSGPGFILHPLHQKPFLSGDGQCSAPALGIAEGSRGAQTDLLVVQHNQVASMTERGPDPRLKALEI